MKPLFSITIALLLLLLPSVYADGSGYGGSCKNTVNCNPLVDPPLICDNSPWSPFGVCIWCDDPLGMIDSINTTCETSCSPDVDSRCDEVAQGSISLLPDICCTGDCQASTGLPVFGGCQCEGGNCAAGYCQSGLTCFYDVECNVTGWKTNDSCMLNDTCGILTLETDKTCTEIGCQSQRFDCNSQNECHNGSTHVPCGGDIYNCHYSNESQYEWYIGLMPHGEETDCQDGHDNDCDGLTDCDDLDCFLSPDCGATATQCQSNNTCDQFDQPCMDFYCNFTMGGYCDYILVGDNEECISGEGVCCNGDCCGPGKACYESSCCTPLGEECGGSDDCCGELECISGHCCHQGDEWCGENCCGFVCCGGVCCNEGEECIGGSCEESDPAGCIPNRTQECEPGECCQDLDLHCSEGHCCYNNETWLISECLLNNGEYCTDGTQCYGGYCCDDACSSTNCTSSLPCVATAGQNDNETNCTDGIDNDCDGFIDCGGLGENPDPDCMPPGLLGCHFGNVHRMDLCGGFGALVDDCSIPCLGGNLCLDCECDEDMAICTSAEIVECIDGDFCCPVDCFPSDDRDCCEQANCGEDDSCCPSSCDHTNDVNCKQCSSNADCDDWNEQTVDTCEDGTCRNTFLVNNPPAVSIISPMNGENYTSESGKAILVFEFVAIDSEDTELECVYKFDGGGIWYAIPSVKSNELTRFYETLTFPENGSLQHVIEIACSDLSGQDISPPVSQVFYLERKESLGGGQKVDLPSPGTPSENQSMVIKEIETITKVIPWEVLVAFMLGVILILMVFLAYSRVSARREAEKASKEVIKKKEEISQEEHLKWLEERQVRLRDKIRGLVEKEASMGLSTREMALKKSHEGELVKIEEELLESEEFEEKLEVRAEKALEEARSGVSSKEIMEELVDEGYTKKEIDVIKGLFQEKKRAD